MPTIVTTDAPAVYKRSPGSSVFTSVTIPTGITQNSPVVRPSVVLYKQRAYIAGQFSKILVWTEDQNLWQAGIAKTSSAPSAAITTGTGITAVGIRYVYTMAEKQGSVIRAESDVSNASTAINSASNAAILVSGLPTTHANARVNYKRLYRSDNGGAYRWVADIALATATYTDSTPTLSLGAVAPVNHAEPPYTKFVETYHDRVWYAGDPSNPQRVYYSELGEGEAVGALNYIDTRDGEAVTGLKRSGDQLIIFGQAVAYDIQGYTASDFRMRKISPSVGCISHHSIVNIDEVLFFASEIGVYVYNGSFRFMMEDLRDYWRDDYASNVSTYQDSIAIDDRYYNSYLLLIPKTSAFYYNGYYIPTWRGEQPYWSFDTRSRQDKTLGVLTPASGAYRFDQYVGSTDGYIRKMNIESDSSDDSDAGNKQLIIQTGALLMGDPGGDLETGGKKFEELWSYVESESSAWSLYALAGDEDCVNAITPNNSTYPGWSDSVAASALVAGGFTYTKDSVHMHRPTGVSGRALSVKIVAPSPVGFKYRGFGGSFIPGPATRPPASSP